jgi:hypothetical protein
LAASNFRMSSICWRDCWVGFELLERDQCRCQRFRHHPFVVAGNSLSWHDDPHPLSGQRKQLPGRDYKPKPQIVTRAASVFFGL